MKMNLLLTGLLALTALSTTAHAAFKVDKVNLLVGSRNVADDLYEGEAGLRGVNRPLANIYIHETDEVTVSERTTFIPVDIRILDKGLLLKAAESSGQMNFIPLNPNLKVSDLFGTYQGGVAGIAFMLNLDESLLLNEHSVILNDAQTIFGGFGARAAYRKILILPAGSGAPNVKVSVIGNRSSSPLRQESMSYSEALQKPLK